MKEPLKAPFIFLFVLLITTAVLSLLDLCAVWGLYDSAARRFDLSYVVGRFPRSIFDVLVPSVIVSIVLLGFRMARRPFSRFLGLAITLGISYIALVNGMLWMKALSAKAPSTVPAPPQYIQPSTFLRVGPDFLSVGSIAGSSLQQVLLFEPTKTASRFSVSPAATASVKAGALAVSIAGRTQGALSGTPDLAWTGVFAPDRFTAFFLRDVDTLTTDLARLLDASLSEFFAVCFALLFLCTASLALLRLTRWPLANVMLLVAAVRGYFSLYHLLAVTLAPRIAAAVSDAFLARMFPAAALAVLGVVLLLVDILFIPADRWKAEVAQ